MAIPPVVLSPDSSAALAAARELGSAGIPVFVLGAKRGPAGFSRYATWVEAPDVYTDRHAWSAFLIQFATKFDVRPVLFPADDAALLAFAEAHDTLSQCYRSSYEHGGVIERVLDKRSLYAAAALVDVATPTYRELGEPSDAPERRNGWLVKPACRYERAGAGVLAFESIAKSPKALPGNPREAAAAVIEAGFPAILQEAIPGNHANLVTVALSLRPDGSVGTFFAARKEREYPEPFGDGLVVRTIPDPGILEPAVRLLKWLGYWGVCELEFKLDRRDDRFKLLDANPRPWSWMTIGAAHRRHVLLDTYNAICRTRRVSKPPNPPKERDLREGELWVSPRSAIPFVTRCYTPKRHGKTLPFRILSGAARTVFADWRTYRDPIRLKPSYWLHALSKPFRKKRKPAASGGD